MGNRLCNPVVEPKKCWWVWFILSIIVVGVAVGLGIGLGTQGEGTAGEDGLFLFTLHSSGEEPFALPILISRDNNKNDKPATGWTDYGIKMGITPLYENNVYKVSFDNPTATKISAISLVYDPLSPTFGSSNDGKDYNYLLMNTLGVGGTYNLYNNGPSDFLKNYNEVVPQYTSNYDTSIDIALTSLQNAGYCTGRPGDHQPCTPFS